MNICRFPSLFYDSKQTLTLITWGNLSGFTLKQKAFFKTTQETQWHQQVWVFPITAMTQAAVRFIGMFSSPQPIISLLFLFLRGHEECFSSVFTTKRNNTRCQLISLFAQGGGHETCCLHFTASLFSLQSTSWPPAATNAY